MTTAVLPSTEHSTLIDALVASFIDTTRSPADVAAPVVILWPDPERRWESLVPRLREAFPHVYTHGTYSPERRTGPSIWLRCIVDRALPDISPADDVTPVLYLPGVSRQVLRAGAECPPEFQPLIELQFRGRVWHQPNGQEWTVEAFLTSRIALELARDNQTRDAMYRTLSLLADADISQLRGRRLQSVDFDALAVDDPVRDLLRWMNDPEGTRRALEDVRWYSLASRAREVFDFDPVTEPPLAAADSIIAGDKRWDAIWNRFAENPRIYPGVSKLLRKADADRNDLAFDTTRRPLANDSAEQELRDALRVAAQLPHHDACARVLALEAKHGPRRQFVWTQLGESPLAMVLDALARLAAAAKHPTAGADVDAIASIYASEGWRTDAAAMEAMAATMKAADAEVVRAIVRALYLPWLDASARQLQQAMEKAPLTRSEDVPAERDVCVLFTDGLRFDVGAALVSVLEKRGITCRLSHRLAAIPSATPSAKPAVSPVASELTGGDAADDFSPMIRESGEPATLDRLRSLMKQHGVVVMVNDNVIGAVSDGGGWAECGKIDALGHSVGVQLAAQLSSQLEQIADRVVALLDGGWTRVRIVTDHGWLLMPGGLPKVEMPKSVTNARWARCALVSGNSSTDMPVFPWRWNPNVRIASPPGAASFVAGNEYAHGGVSPQECVIPEIIAQRGAAAVAPTIKEVKWSRLRCRVTVSDAEGGSMVDIRTNWKDATTSIVAAPRAVDSAGSATVFVHDDTLEGKGAVAVLLDSHGKVVARTSTTVGGD